MRPRTVSVICNFQTGIAKIQFQSFVNYHWKSGNTYPQKRGSFIERSLARIINENHPRVEYKGPRGGWCPNSSALILYHFNSANEKVGSQ